ncbi:hypothetical protein GCM10010507_10110 [Streptomyces cinnamoneus]|uniref:Uncharacterized protein n=2 Tax=Streptomyces cinnamoneus TaxID=53446 RepID=A0A918TD77_STRCJ|nr:hypothetical protein GCM10010507_10110 [Streptomyces cinnamoneus]
MIDGVVAAVSVAAATYGRNVLDQGEVAAEQATVRLGRRLLERLRRNPDSDAQISRAVLAVADDPEDEDYTAVLRAKVERALGREDGLASDLAALLAESGVGLATVSGDRSVRMTTNHGIVSLGDNVRNSIANPG